MNSENKKTIGLALGGGSVLGAAHIGVLKALEEKKIEINHISGTSIGALVASLYAFGKSIEAMELIAKEINWSDISEVTLSKFGLLSNDKMKTLLKKHLGDVNIEDAKIPLSIVTANIENGQKVVLEEGNLANAVAASACIPGIFIPQKINGQMLVDGGILENLPISPLLSSCDLIIAVDVLSKKKYQKPESVIDVLLNSFHFMIAKPSVYYPKEKIQYILPNLSEFSLIKMNQSKSLIEIGYKETISNFTMFDTLS